MSAGRRYHSGRFIAYGSFLCVFPLLISYQNCGGSNSFRIERFSSTDANSYDDPSDPNSSDRGGNGSEAPPSGETPTVDGPPNREKPTLSGDFSARVIQSGIGALSGDGEVIVNVMASPGKGEEKYQQVQLECEFGSGRGDDVLDIESCDATEGRIVIRPDEDQSCQTGSFQLSVRARDIIDPSQYPSGNVPQSLYSPAQTLNLQVQNNCLSEVQLLASDGMSQDQLGGQVALDGTTAVALSSFKDSSAANAGAAYVYRLQGASWVEEAKLVASDASADESLNSVDVRGDFIAIGSPYHSSLRGAVYLFSRSGSAWTLLKKIASPGADLQFGFSVSLSPNGSLLAVGAPGAGGNKGAVYVYDLSNYSSVTLQASDSISFDEFGTEVDMDDDRVVVGAPTNVLFSDSRTGSAYVFERSGSSWNENKLDLKDVANGSRFGASVAIENSRVAVGAPLRRSNRRDHAGGVYVYDRSSTGWSRSAVLTHNDVGSSNEFGVSVALQNNLVLAGAHRNTVNGSSRQGAAYLFEHSGGKWNLLWKLVSRDGQDRDYFGGSVRLFGEKAIVGARNSRPKGDNSGSAFVFDLP